MRFVQFLFFKHALVIVLLNILLIIFNMSVSKNVSTDSSTTFIEIGEDDVIDVE